MHYISVCCRFAVLYYALFSIIRTTVSLLLRCYADCWPALVAVATSVRPSSPSRGLISKTKQDRTQLLWNIVLKLAPLILLPRSDSPPDTFWGSCQESTVAGQFFYRSDDILVTYALCYI